MRLPVALYGNDYKNKLDTVRLLFFLIDKCNYNCSYCYNALPRKNIELDAADIVRFVKHVHEQTSKLVRIEFIGGEVALYKNLHSLCSELHSLEYVIDIEIYSNLFKDIEYYNTLVEKSCVEVNGTWHSTQADKQNNSFIDKVISIPDELFKHYYITIMFEPDAIAESKNAFERIQERHPFAHNIEYSLCIQSNTNKPYKYKDEDLQYFYSKCAETSFNRKEFYVEYNDKTVEKLTFNDLQGMKINNFKYWSCNAGLDYLFIDVDGNVYKCAHDNKHNMLLNISQDSYPALPTKPCICMYDYCPCTWEIYRRKIFR